MYSHEIIERSKKADSMEKNSTIKFVEEAAAGGRSKFNITATNFPFRLTFLLSFSQATFDIIHFMREAY